MLLLLIMYLAPFVAIALFLRSQSVTASLAADVDAGEREVDGAWNVLKATVEGRLTLARPVAGATLASALVIGLADGATAGLALLAGAVFTVAFAALAQSSMLAAVARSGAPTSKAAWTEGSGIALGLASLVAGAVGGLAWFFADPSGVIVLVSFLLGASSAGLFVAMGGADRAQGNPSPADVVREVATWSLPAPMHAQLAATAATLLVAATAQPENILGLGGLLAETETLRSELLLLPVAVTLVSPVVAMMAGPLFPSLSRSGHDGEYFDAERIAALATLLVIGAIVILGGLSWSLTAAMACGLLARQVALVGDEGLLRARRAGRLLPGGPALMPALVAALALAAGGRLAGDYGVALVALGMTATFASASGAAVSRAVFAIRNRLPLQGATSGASGADAATSIAATLALMVASGPVLVAESVHRGLVVDLVVMAAPALLLGVVVGAAAAGNWSLRVAQKIDEAELARSAAWAAGACAVVPALAGALFGSGAAFGVVLGFTAWAAASSPTAAGERPASAEEARLRRSVVLAWARTMALAALVAAPLMN